MLITAGAGTGKTHTLIARLIHLVEDRRLSPGAEILVLSFSRAAVYEIRRRLRNVDGDASMVHAATFDSFATRLLAAHVPDGPWQTTNYEGRIEAATRLTAEDVDVREEIGDYAHILVDEIQDLVAPRSEFVQAILDASQGGFTLFGDPAQGIYTFQLAKEEARRLGSKVLYRELRRRFGAELVEKALERNHRVQGKAAGVALWAGPLLNDENPNYEDIRERLLTDVLGLPPIGTVEAAARALAANDTPTAVLCRNNGQALMVSRHFRESGAEHRLQRSASDRAVAPWIGRALGSLDHPRAPRDTVLARLIEDCGLSQTDADACWRLLKRLERRRGEDLDVDVVARSLRAGDAPDELTTQEPARLVVSTIHRAKGLEFDRVVLAEPDHDLMDGSDVGEEARLLYVALTRPKRELFHMEAPNTVGMRRLALADRRWIRRYRRWQNRDFEVQGDDAHGDDPPGFHREGGAAELQDYLWSEVCSGDPVTLHRIESPTSFGEPFAYEIEHRDRRIGLMSERFMQTLHRVLKINSTWVVNWPVRLERLHIEGVDSVAGSAAGAERAGLGRALVWLRPRVSGLGSLRFEPLKCRRDPSQDDIGEIAADLGLEVVDTPGAGDDDEQKGRRQ